AVDCQQSTTRPPLPGRGLIIRGRGPGTSVGLDPIPPQAAGWAPEQKRAEERDRLFESLVRVQVLVFVLDRHHVVVADQPERADDVSPEGLTVPVADGPEGPRSPRELRVGPGVEDAVDPDVV